MIGGAYFGRTYAAGLPSGRGAGTAPDTSASSDSASQSRLGSLRTGTASETSTSSDLARRLVVRRAIGAGFGGAYLGGFYPGAYALGRFTAGGDGSLTSDRARLSRAILHLKASDASQSSDFPVRSWFPRLSEHSATRDTIGGGRVIPLGHMAPIGLRERAPLRLTVSVRTPDGQFGRWAGDDPQPGNAPSSLSFSTAMPGGFESMSCSLQRDPSRSYRDLEELSRINVLGAGGEIAWEGRLESLPDVGGDQEAINPAGVGYQSHLDDDNSARALIVDRNLTHWISPGITRQIHALRDLTTSVYGPSIGPDMAPNAQPLPSLVTAISGEWTENKQSAEAWFNARGIPIQRLYAAWQTLVPAGDVFDSTHFYAQMGIGDNDSDDPANASGALTTSPGTGFLTDSAGRAHAMLRLFNQNVSGGVAGADMQVFWNVVAVYGDSSFPTQGDFTATDAPGILASDGIAYLLPKFAPLIGVTSDSIQRSSFVIPQAAWLDPTKLSEMVKELAKYELLDWAIWEGPTFYLNARGTRGRKWRARTGPAQLQEAGPQISRLWNGVIVTWADVTGFTMSVGPPGSGADYTDATLLDTDPQNPVNQVTLPGGGTLRRWTVAAMGTSTLGAATQIGRIFLQEQKKLNQAGQASLVGHVQDENGVFWPAWMVRAGDRISFVDAADASYRRIVHTNYDDSSKTCTVQLDQPPDSLQAILERLNIVLAPYGM